MPRSLTFRQYLAAWSKEATKGLIDRFGLLNLLVSFALWAWNRYSPTTLEATAKELHLYVSAAMSDWIWQSPLLVGVALVGYRFVRAPYEMHLQTLANGQDIENRQAEDREIKDRAKRTGTFIADGVLLLRTAPQGQAAALALDARSYAAGPGLSGHARAAGAGGQDGDQAVRLRPRPDRPTRQQRPAVLRRRLARRLKRIVRPTRFASRGGRRRR